MVCKAVLVDALVCIAHAPACSGHAPGTSHRGPALEAVLRVLGPVQRDPLSASKAGASALMPCKTFTEVCPKGRGPNSPWKNCRILGPFPTEISNRQNSRLALILGTRVTKTPQRLSLDTEAGSSCHRTQPLSAERCPAWREPRRHTQTRKARWHQTTRSAGRHWK